MKKSPTSKQWTTKKLQPTSESDVDRKQHALKIAKQLAKTYTDVNCALTHRSPFELTVATILSAQCTDERVNMVTPALFKKYPTPSALAASKQEDVENIIRSTGFFRAKATNIRGMAIKLVKDFGGEVPRTLEEMVTLPGVGRKTGNVVLGTCFGLATGVVVDTHVKRITRLLGLTTRTQPEQIETDLMELLPRKEWINFSHRLIHHGRRICIARRPNCIECPLLNLCPRVGLRQLEDEHSSD
ncbi:MAG: endonuclease III [Planctomycetota bacterium]|nr:endonuclease III [Planctomycetota bacterium]MDA1212385.1 endonuclease III [Planctomycetota bacterium]